MEWLDSLRIIFGFVVAAVSFTALIWKKPRRWILGYFKRKRREKIQEIEDAVLKVFAPKFEDIKKQIEDLADKNEENHQQVMANAEKTDIIIEVQKQILRNSIKGLYEKGMTQGYLTKYDKKSIMSSFAVYRDMLKGNGYIEMMVGEVLKLDTKEN